MGSYLGCANVIATSHLLSCRAQQTLRILRQHIAADPSLYGGRDKEVMRSGPDPHKPERWARVGRALIYLQSKEENVRNLWKGGLAILGAIAISTVGMTEAHAQNYWSPRIVASPYEMNGFLNKEVTTVADVMAGKDPSQSWRQKVVEGQNLRAYYVGLKLGDSTKKRMSSDHRLASSSGRDRLKSPSRVSRRSWPRRGP